MRGTTLHGCWKDFEQRGSLRLRMNLSLFVMHERLTRSSFIYGRRLRQIDAILDMVESWRSRMSLASLVQDLKRICISSPPKDVASAQSPVEQTVDTEQNTSPSNFCLISV